MSDFVLDPQVERDAEHGIGDNSANVPLVEQLVGELAEEQKRADELLLSAAQSRIENAADAGKIADLILMIRVLERTLEKKRDGRKQPFQADTRIVDATYAALITPLSRARIGEGSLSERLTAWTRDHPHEAPIAMFAAIGARRRQQYWVDDLKATVDWLVVHHPHEMLQAARSIIGRFVRERGVDETDAIDIPGVRIEIEHHAIVR